MGKFTHYLTVLQETPGKFILGIEEDTPLNAIERALSNSQDLRYSPILPAYLIPGELPKSPPSIPNSIAFYFSDRPYSALGTIRPALSQSERDLVFFSEGLASILLVDFDRDRAIKLQEEIGCAQMELWFPDKGILTSTDVTVLQQPMAALEGLAVKLH